MLIKTFASQAQMPLDVSNFGYPETIDTTVNHTFFNFLLKRHWKDINGHLTLFVSLETNP